jgi:sortase (surface protein transpeptidase)
MLHTTTLSPSHAAASSTTKLAPVSASVPVRVQIPAIGVDSSLIALGLEQNGTMQVPPSGFPAGWYTGEPTPGESGPAIIVGHVDWGGHPGVFFRLRDVRPGDEIVVGRTDGSSARFRVTRLEAFAKTNFPTGQVYGATDNASLRLITCGGSFDQQAHSYRDNVVAFADLVSFSPHGA